MKKVAITIGVLVVMACFLSGSLAFAGMPGADPDALWHYITKVSPYKEWSFWPDHQGMQPGRAPHGPLHKVYVNRIQSQRRRLVLGKVHTRGCGQAFWKTHGLYWLPRNQSQQ
jgi:hypothetical protein